MKKRTMLALLAAAPAVAFAQTGGRRRGGDKGGAKGGGTPQINQLEATLGEFETDLKLAADQQKAWNAYAARPADGGGGHRRFGEGPPEDSHPRAAHDGRPAPRQPHRHVVR